MRQDNSKRKNENTNINTIPEGKRTKDCSNKIVGNELSCSSSANDSIYFRIVHSKDEFYQFQDINLEYTFHPTFTHQLFSNQIISGYKNLKILITLTSKRLYPHIKIIYDKVLTYKDNIEEILQKHFASVYTTNDDLFLNRLDEEKAIKPSGISIKKEKRTVEREILFIDILKDKYEEINWNYQYLLTFFIDGASFIPIEDNFWNYFLVIERGLESNESQWKLIGFCSYKNFHMALDRYCSMISQFWILPPYQRMGYGNFLLENIYDYLIDIGDECVEISTEDPANEFILMRDCTLIKMILSKGSIDSYLKLLGKENEINTQKVYDSFKLNSTELIKITKAFKIQKNLIQRTFDIIKQALVSNNFKSLLINEKKEQMAFALKDETCDSIFKDKTYGPFVFFHDEPEYNIDEVIAEERANLNQEITGKTVNY